MFLFCPHIPQLLTNPSTGISMAGIEENNSTFFLPILLLLQHKKMSVGAVQAYLPTYYASMVELMAAAEKEKETWAEEKTFWGSDGFLSTEHKAAEKRHAEAMAVLKAAMEKCKPIVAHVELLLGKEEQELNKEN